VKKTVAKCGKSRLISADTTKWVTFSFETAEIKLPELTKLFDALAEAAAGTDKSVCIVLETLKLRPNSKILATLVNLLTAAGGKNRAVALVSPGKEWVDMLDILGVRARFEIVDSVDLLAGHF